MTASDDQTKLFFPAEYAVLVSPDAESDIQKVAENYTDSKGQPLDEADLEQVSASLLKQNPHTTSTIPPNTVLSLPTSIALKYFLKKKNKDLPELPKQPPHPPKQSTPPDAALPKDPIWDWNHHHTLDKGGDTKEPDGCVGHFENVVEVDGTQEQRTRAGSFVFIRFKEKEGKDIVGVPIKIQYCEIVRAPRWAVRTWQLQRTARYFVEVCPGDKHRQTLQSAGEPMWVQLEPDEYIAGPPEEVLAVETGPVGPVAGTLGLGGSPQKEAEKWAKQYEHDHPGVIYEPALNGKEIK
jgi:hypothetical protein